jgi:hypothetical protein
LGLLEQQHPYLHDDGLLCRKRDCQCHQRRDRDL